MVMLNIVVDGTREPSGPAINPATALHVQQPVTIIGMPKGTVEGQPTVILRTPLPDGREVFIETTLALLSTAVDGLRSYYYARA
jgi:hypothetical protein